MKQTYAKAGVSRELRKKAKSSFKSFAGSFKTPFNLLYPVGKNLYQVKTSDGVGTKVLLAQVLGKHDTVGIDAVAMVANDCIRCGAKPQAITDIIDIKKSDPELLAQLQKGLAAGAREALCPLVGGETADVPELLRASYYINCDCVGQVKKENIITGKEIKPGDVVLGFSSSGLHSNGFTLARKVLFKKWGGKFGFFAKPAGLKLSLIEECLKPTRIYVQPFLKVAQKFKVLGAVHITGDGYLKFAKLMQDRLGGSRSSASSPSANLFERSSAELSLSPLGFEFDNFKPQPIFDIIQKTGKISDKEMFKTFNMGWGFALVVRKAEAPGALALLKKEKIRAELIGRVTLENKIVIKYKEKTITLWRG